MGTTTAQVSVVQAEPEPVTKPLVDNAADEYGEIVPIPMPPLAHPAGEQAHPWSD